MKAAPGTVYLVGAGPGDPGLMTVRGRALLELADVVVHDRLIGSEILTFTRPEAELIDVGKEPGDHKVPQDQIEELLVDRARRGLRVVRLKGGDPFVFGRGFEELQACRKAGVPCVVLPGVSSAIAAPEAAGIPITLRGVSRSFAVLTAGVAPGSPEIDFAAFDGVDTLIVLMGRARLANVVEGLLAAGRDPSTPAACVERATTPEHRVVRAPLRTLIEAVERTGLASPMVIVVGEVAAFAEGKCGGFGLEGKRVLVTRSDVGIDDTLQALLAFGAVPILMPLIRIDYAVAEKVRIEVPLRHDWIALTSVHGVYGFWRVLQRAGLDSRTLGGCKVAAVGSATARALRNQGIAADLVPSEQTSAGLAQALLHAGMAKGCRVLHPHGDLACFDVTERLRGAGVQVDEMLVYSTVDAMSSEVSVKELEKGVDAILFFSPSAVRRFLALGLQAKESVIGCIGPTTAKAATEAGLRVHFIPATRTGEALVSSLAEHFIQPRGR